MSSSEKESYTTTAAIDIAGARGKAARGDVVSPAPVKILETLRNKDMLVPGSLLDPEIRNEYRRIKRPLLSNAFGKSASLVDQGNLILVTSSVPGEGKTYTSINLALTIAQEQNSTVLLIDADVSRQGASRFLGIDRRRPDFSDVLSSDDVSVGDALLRTDIPGLVVLPAGRYYEYITEMMASNRMDNLVKELARRYSDRIIIFDSPPLLSTPETQVLAGLVGQVVMVIQAGATPRKVVEDALELLPKDKAIGVVLNRAESLTSRGGYYHSYYTPYGEKKEE